MNCREAQRKISDYIQRNLDRSELDEFLNHVMNCPSCYEELELYYTLFAGLQELDGNTEETKTLQEMLDAARKDSRGEMQAQKRRWDLYYISSTVMFWTVLAAAIAEIQYLFKYMASTGWLFPFS